MNRHRIILFHKYGKTLLYKILVVDFFSKFKQFWFLFWVCWSCIIKICWIKISKNTPEKKYFIFVLNVCNCFLFQHKIRMWDIRRPPHWFIVNSMNFKIEYFFKIPTATIPLINSNFVENLYYHLGKYFFNICYFNIDICFRVRIGLVLFKYCFLFYHESAFAPWGKLIQDGF